MYISLIISGEASLISMAFSCLCCITQINHFFPLYQQNKSSECKETSDRLAIIVKGFLMLSNLLMLIKQKSLSIPRNVALVTFGKLLIAFLRKVNLLYLLHSTVQRCCLLHLIKRNCFLKTFLRTLMLMNQVRPYLLSLLELIWNCIIFP